jgi:hypothetical protein
LLPGRLRRSSRKGAIAQLGERVVRNDEVGGSIPPGSTSLRWLCQLRLGKPYRSEGCRGEACMVKMGNFLTGATTADVRPRLRLSEKITLKKLSLSAIVMRSQPLR